MIWIVIMESFKNKTRILNVYDSEDKAKAEIDRLKYEGKFTEWYSYKSYQIK